MGSPIEKVDGGSSCYIVTTGDVVITITKATTDKVSISSVTVSGLVQFISDDTTCPRGGIEEHKVQETA